MLKVYDASQYLIIVSVKECGILFRNPEKRRKKFFYRTMTNFEILRPSLTANFRYVTISIDEFSVFCGKKEKVIPMKKILSFVLVCVLMCTMTYGASAKTFSDVSSAEPFYKAVSKLSDIGVIAGKGDGNFNPYDATTRAEFCAFLSRANGYKDHTVSGTVPFRDVPDTYWAVNPIYFCYSKGYISGMGNGTFEPARKITYEEAVKMVVNAAGVSDSSLIHAGPYWYSGYLDRASQKGFLSGFTVKPGQPIPRGHVAQIIYNAMEKGYLGGNSTKSTSPPATVAPTATPKPTATPTVKPERTASADGKRIVIDAGHNHQTVDTGAAGNGLKEQDVTWEIAEKLRIHLQRNGFEVIMTRPKTTDSLGTTVRESLQQRVDIANRNNADLFLSIHCNSGGGTGTETYCYQFGGNGEKLAKLVQKMVVQETGLTDRGVKAENLFVIKNTIMPAILLETAFIDKESDAQFLASSSGQEKFAVAIAKAVCQFKGLQYR